jgi:hypothetical protein
MGFGNIYLFGLFAEKWYNSTRNWGAITVPISGTLTIKCHNIISFSSGDTVKVYAIGSNTNIRLSGGYSDYTDDSTVSTIILIMFKSG